MWDTKRKDQLKTLQSMLLKLGALNQGSGFMDKLSDCITEAKRLTDFSLTKADQSFVSFLIEQANRE